jgi:hypothetical protein
MYNESGDHPQEDLATKQKGNYQIINHPSMLYIIGYKLKTKYRNVVFCR